MRLDISKYNTLDKSTVYNYEYEYWQKSGEFIINKDVDRCEKYGTSRKGYENFKNEVNCSIGYGGVTSLREIIEDKEVTGYVIEKKLSNTPYIDEARKIYEDQLQEMINFLKVKDEKSFLYYIEDHFFDPIISGNVIDYKQGAISLNEVLEEYEENEDFRKYFNKIIF